MYLFNCSIPILTLLLLSFKVFAGNINANTSRIQVDHEHGIIQLFRLGRLGYEKLRIEIMNPENVDSIRLLNARSLVSDLSVQPVHIIANSKLSYTITLNPQEPLPTSNMGDATFGTPDSFRLTNIYPNPFKSFTNIVFEVNSPSDIYLSMYNVVGENVFFNHQGYFESGRYTVQIDRGHLIPGVYYVNLEGKKWTQAKPVIINH